MDELPKPSPSPDAAPSTQAPEPTGASETERIEPVQAAEAVNEVAAPPEATSEVARSGAPTDGPVAAPSVDERAVAFRRVTRQASLLALALCVVTLAGTAFSQREGPPDLAAKKPWRASSKYADCHPERFDCSGAKTGIFFHTNFENGPWVEVDLLAPTTFSRATVRNRTDCCQERAVPLILEVSDDRTTWREVARHEVTFSRWEPKFEPTTARYVRLRVPRQTFLHLDAFKVHP